MITPEQLNHIVYIQEQASKLIQAKYQRGAEEHGGDLWSHDELWFVEQALNEAIDQVIYLICLRNMLRDPYETE